MEFIAQELAVKQVVGNVATAKCISYILWWGTYHNNTQIKMREINGGIWCMFVDMSAPREGDWIVVRTNYCDGERQSYKAFMMRRRHALIHCARCLIDNARYSND